MDLLALKRKALGFHALDNWGGSSSNDGGSSTSYSGSGEGSTGGSYSNWNNPPPEPPSPPVTLAVDSAASSPAPSAVDSLPQSPNENMTLAQNMGAYVGAVRGEQTPGYSEFAGKADGLGQILPHEVLPSASSANGVLTVLKTLLGIAGLATPAAAQSAVGLGTMAANGAYSNLGSPSTVMDGASEAWYGPLGDQVGNTWGSGSQVVGWQGNIANPTRSNPAVSRPINSAPGLLNLSDLFGIAPGAFNSNGFAPTRMNAAPAAAASKQNNSSLLPLLLAGAALLFMN